MKKLTIKDGNKTMEIWVNRTKYILSSYLEKYLIKQKIKQYFDKSTSEWREENPKLQVNVQINDKPVSRSRGQILEISPEYSLNEDCKLGTKSLLYKYLETKLTYPQYFDTINTINLLFEEFSNEISEEDIIHSSFVTMTTKQLLKLIIPSYIDEFQKDDYDLSYEENIYLQIKIIKEIAKANQTIDNLIVLADIPIITPMILDSLYTCENCIILILTTNYLEGMLLDDICLIENKVLDIANEEQIYYLLNEQTYKPLSIKEAKDKVTKYIQNKYALKSTDLINNILHFKS